MTLSPVKHHRPVEVQGLQRGVARCRIEHGDLTAAATSEVITWATLVAAHATGSESPPANARILYAWANLITEFAGGSVSACVVAVGDAGNDDELLAAVDIFTGAGTGLKTINGAYTLGTFEAAYTPIVTVTTTTDNVVNLTAGALEICIAYEAISTDPRVIT